ncbi:MAG: 1,6-anhydro-N-acetylmuramyl-L-alanine amidase AmpD [Magnetococcus sp. YQC-5]
MVRFLLSPHADSRPVGTEVNLLVVHAITVPPGEFGGPHVDDLFMGRLNPDAHPAFPAIAGMRVSAHFFIDRNGGLTQYVPVMRRAWHAGVSQWEGRTACNDYSVGVELEGVEAGPPDKMGFERIQYERLTVLARTLMTHLLGLTPERIVGHQDIAPGRKWDPGSGFDWVRFHTLLSQARPDEKNALVWE